MGKKEAKQEPVIIKEKPEYLEHRIAMFDRLKAEYDQKIAAMPRVPITISFPDGKTINGTAWETTPMMIAKDISKSLAERTIIAKVDGELFDMLRVLEKDCMVQFLDFDSDDGKKVFWHSSAHVLGEACELNYGCHLCIGPPIEQGFYYEMATEKPISTDDYPRLEQLSKQAVQEKQSFVRLEMTKSDLLDMFKHNKYKVHLINDKVPDGTTTTVYRCGPLIDLCYGPHVINTGKIKALKVTKNSSSYFLGDAANDSLQRVYGISFPEAKLLKEWEEFMAEAEKRDHRKIGSEQALFFFNDLSPGSAFFLPNGTRIYNTLLELMRSEYRKRGFSEVITPNIYNSKLWETSGHWQNYEQDMFTLTVDKEKWALKPMNCPGHCVMFKNRDRSYRELPIRFADFGVLHRNEASGALSGLTRVRRFQQDDAHIFCRLDQVEEELFSCLDFLKHIYGVFGFEFSLKLSTRPEKYLGEISLWDKAEEMLKLALVKFGKSWELNPGDGAFYGPKIDIVLSDALKRKHQCATIQLDFQLPERFKLEYQTSDPDNQFARPVMIHRAILGSLERQIAILTENFGGKWPFWLSPRQLIVIPVTKTIYDYAQKLADDFNAVGLYCDVDVGGDLLNKKIRNAEIGQWNFILVVGAEEESTNSVNCRNRDNMNSKNRGDVISVEVATKKFLELKKSRQISHDDF